MDFPLMIMSTLLAFLLLGGVLASKASSDISFNVNYNVTWGYDHVMSSNQGREIQLSMDNYSGAGFGSKLSYGSGFFHLRIKQPEKDSAGVVTAFYLTSHTHNRDELDFEFLGNREGKPYTLQTNVFSNGQGNREQRTLLWFDPTADFHSYKILWNHHLIVFFVDNIPIRVFKNNTNIGVSYPSQPMQIEASLWNGDSWATDGGNTKINWSHAPFKAYFQGFNVNGCPSINHNYYSNIQHCSSSKYWWNTRNYWKLDSNQQRAYEAVRTKYMNYDYCGDRPRYPTPPPECLSQW
ncbi:unnamed protein product [Ilex paraguariensis]|uniref:Xyloglucan endotransglucosylase/hydrolase n=1 Tax=Ilex paraguariensis TaxID=185542 RepID=A0ABC8SPQ5_9AQUA